MDVPLAALVQVALRDHNHCFTFDHFLLTFDHCLTFDLGRGQTLTRPEFCRCEALRIPRAGGGDRCLTVFDRLYILTTFGHYGVFDRHFDRVRIDRIASTMRM